MTVCFYLRYQTKFGQSLFVSGDIDVLGNDKAENAFALSYFNNDFWMGKIKILPNQNFTEIRYRYTIREEGNTDIVDADNDRIIDLSGYLGKEIVLIDTWNAGSNINNVFYTKPFLKVLHRQPYTVPKIKEPKFFTHQFKVKVPLLTSDEWVCITGSGTMFKNWDVKTLLPLKQLDNWYSLKIKFNKDDFPLRYKYGIYNSKTKTFTYEEGSDRVLFAEPAKDQKIILHDGFIQLQKIWRGAGLAIPVFSLRSKNGFGTGEFNDIKLLVDWAKQTGLKLLQFLPVNDTTATSTAKDSYPYSAISAFALHPIYINIDKVASGHYASLIRPFYKVAMAFLSSF